MKNKDKKDIIGFIIALIFIFSSSMAISLSFIISIVDNFSVISILILSGTIAELTGLLYLVRYVRMIYDPKILLPKKKK